MTATPRRSVLSMSKGYAAAAVLALAVLSFTIIPSTFPVRGADTKQDRYRQVLELNPVGYWPADEGEGEVVHDRSGNDNHGKAHFVSWQDGLLDFENDVYQWVQIPHHSSYNSESFSMGGWVFPEREYPDDKHNYGVIFIGQPFKYQGQGGGNVKWGAIWGQKVKNKAAMLRFGPPGIYYVDGRENEQSKGGKGLLVEVLSGGKKDAVGSVDEDIAVAINEWQHILYTYDGSGTGKIYRNGRLVCSGENVSYSPDETPYVVGGGRWGTWNRGNTVSMDGSVRDMVLFDRALKSGEVKRLVRNTKPDVVPSGEDGSGEDSQEKQLTQEELIKRVQDGQLEEEVRAEAALALAEMGPDASAAVPVLGKLLMRITERVGTHPPRIEEPLRNAVMRALLDIAPEEERVRDLLGKTLAKPFFKTLDGSKSYLDEIRPMVREGRYMDALEALRNHLQDVPAPPKLGDWGADHNAEQLAKLRDALPLREEYSDAYISTGNAFMDAQYNAYTQTFTHDGTTYVPVVESVDYETVLNEYYEHDLDNETDADVEPGKKARGSWQHPRKWARLVIHVYDADGSVRKVNFGPSWLIFDVYDEKMAGWTMAMDEQGYFHMFGGQHNQPDRGWWIPGSWEKLGIAEGDDRPEIMYWVSSKPGDIGSFEFAGQRGNTRHPDGDMNYMQLVRSPEDTLFLYGRGDKWSWALQRYDAEEQRWTELEGSFDKMMERARQENPEWYNGLGDTNPYFARKGGLVDAWQPGAYNFNRAMGSGVLRGVQFDRTGRMHVQMPILGVGEKGRMTSGPVYAYSDDLGETFHRADGTRLKLPLTVNPIPSHNANLNHHDSSQWFDLWASLIQEAGWKMKGGFDR